MNTEDSTVSEASAAVDAGHDDGHDVAELDHLAETTTDPALRRELEASIANGQSASRGFRKAVDRFWMTIQFGR
ncbi:MAG TPA: hypothetical protein VKR79_08990 [Gaiellaceae bacterium]|nr:hypothetical protein [Gaiellaceae bacterium]